MNIKVPQLVVEIFLLVLGQIKALHLLSTGVYCEDDRASFANSSWPVNLRDELFPVTQAVVGELDAEQVIPYNCNDVTTTEGGCQTCWDVMVCAASESKVVIGSIVFTLETTT